MLSTQDVHGAMCTACAGGFGCGAEACIFYARAAQFPMAPESAAAADGMETTMRDWSCADALDCGIGDADRNRTVGAFLDR